MGWVSNRSGWLLELLTELKINLLLPAADEVELQVGEVEVVVVVVAGVGTQLWLS